MRRAQRPLRQGQYCKAFLFLLPGLYTIEVVVTAEGCERDFEAEVEVLFDPTVAFDGGPVLGCPPLPVSFENFLTDGNIGLLSLEFWRWHHFHGTFSQSHIRVARDLHGDFGNEHHWLLRARAGHNANGICGGVSGACCGFFY